jgi:hypothetical protein
MGIVALRLGRTARKVRASGRQQMGFSGCSAPQSTYRSFILPPIYGPVYPLSILAVVVGVGG